MYNYGNILCFLPGHIDIMMILVNKHKDKDLIPQSLLVYVKVIDFLVKR